MGWLKFFKIPKMIGAKLQENSNEISIATRSISNDISKISFSKRTLDEYPQNFQLKVSEIPQDTQVTVLLMNEKNIIYSYYILTVNNPSIFISLKEVDKMEFIVPNAYKKVLKVDFVA